MTSLRGVVAMVMTVAMAASVTADWYTEPEWSFLSKLDEDYTLVCNDSTVGLQSGERVDWHRPDGTQILNISAHADKYQLIDMNGVRAHSLTIKHVANSDGGIYLCMVFDHVGSFRLKVNRALNMKGPMVEGLGRFYYNITVAFVSAAIFLVLALVSCFLVHFNYESRYQRRYGHLSPAAKSVPSGGLANSGFDTGSSDGVTNASFEVEDTDTRL